MPNEIKKQLLFAILLSTMPSDTPSPQPSPVERREFYRITVLLPICLQLKSDQTEATLIERSVNISGGGIGVTLNQTFEVNNILSCTLLLPGQVLFKSYVEVLRIDPITYPLNTYRLHGRFVRMANQDRELLIRHVIQFQREHLTKHYSA
ncbi:MAG: PilZ domain-containing protein [Nitrospira sp. LK70]|nr:PilZ domain-containing protein [Nitrospira sp. LK70]